MLKRLAESISGKASMVAVGLNWTLVEGPDGIGLAHSPVKGTSGCYNLRGAGQQRGKPLAELAASIYSDNPFDRALALASLNAHFNRPDQEGTIGNGLDLFANNGSINTVAIGRFPNIEVRFPNVKVIEKNPGQNDYPTSKAAQLLVSADQVIISASVLSSREIVDYLNAASNAKVMLIGPGTPMTPGLFENGISILAGFIVTKPSHAIDVVVQGGSINQLRKCGRNICLHQV
tara:strand:- start:3033 stop:3731 length:699 start_codon:yes stop_codon:yes gene_type:complete